MAKHRLSDNEIIEMREEIQAKQVGIKQLELRYISGEIYVDAVGIENIPQIEDYYDNVEDHITFSNLSWFSPLCNLFEVNIESSVKVNPDGTFNHDEIELELNTVILGDRLNKQQIQTCLHSILVKLVPFRSYLTNVEFGWHGYSLRKVRFGMKLDGKKVNTILKNNKEINTQILGQWSTTISQVIDYNKGRYKHMVNIPIVNGRMNVSTYQTALCFRFDGKGRR